MRHVIGAACGLWLGYAGAAAAQSQPVVVVELFTSQGCSSCPPADAFMSRLAADPRVIALALHVDYWDYIGWEDAFGQEAFTSRQKAYAKNIGSRTIYTPQFIIGGQERVEGNQPEAVEALVATHSEAIPPVSLDLRREGGTVTIDAKAEPPLTAPVRIQLVRYRPSETVMIERGENAGMTVDYANIVTSWQDVGEWGGQEPLHISAPAEGEDPLVVILQSQGPANVIAAARVD